MEIMHDLKVYPLRVSMTVVMKTSNSFCLPVKIEGTDRDKLFAGDLLLPFNEGRR